MKVLVFYQPQFMEDDALEKALEKCKAVGPDFTAVQVKKFVFQKYAVASFNDKQEQSKFIQTVNNKRTQAIKCTEKTINAILQDSNALFVSPLPNIELDTTAKEFGQVIATHLIEQENWNSGLIVFEEQANCQRALAVNPFANQSNSSVLLIKEFIDNPESVDQADALIFNCKLHEMALLAKKELLQKEDKSAKQQQKLVDEELKNVEEQKKKYRERREILSCRTCTRSYPFVLASLIQMQDIPYKFCQADVKEYVLRKSQLCNLKYDMDDLFGRNPIIIGSCVATFGCKTAEIADNLISCLHQNSDYSCVYAQIDDVPYYMQEEDPFTSKITFRRINSDKQRAINTIKIVASGRCIQVFNVDSHSRVEDVMSFFESYGPIQSYTRAHKQRKWEQPVCRQRRHRVVKEKIDPHYNIQFWDVQNTKQALLNASTDEQLLRNRISTGTLKITMFRPVGHVCRRISFLTPDNKKHNPEQLSRVTEDEITQEQHSYLTPDNKKHSEVNPEQLSRVTENEITQASFTIVLTLHNCRESIENVFQRFQCFVQGECFLRNNLIFVKCERTAIADNTDLTKRFKFQCQRVEIEIFDPDNTEITGQFIHSNSQQRIISEYKNNEIERQKLRDQRKMKRMKEIKEMKEIEEREFKERKKVIEAERKKKESNEVQVKAAEKVIYKECDPFE